METVGPVELLVILAIVLLLFGSKKLPDVARSVGQAVKEFRKATHDDASTDDSGRP